MCIRVCVYVCVYIYIYFLIYIYIWKVGYLNFMHPQSDPHLS